MEKKQKITIISIVLLLLIILKNKMSSKTFSGKVRTLRINSGYGWRVGGFHLGTDYQGKTGERVFVKKAGKVLRVEKNCVVGRRGCGGGWGNFVEIEHTPEIKTLYAHLTDVNVNSGDTIEPYDVIGTIGNTGRSNGAHLHFEYWLNNVRVDGKNFANDYFGIEEK